MDQIQDRGRRSQSATVCPRLRSALSHRERHEAGTSRRRNRAVGGARDGGLLRQSENYTEVNASVYRETLKIGKAGDWTDQIASSQRLPEELTRGGAVGVKRSLAFDRDATGIASLLYVVEEGCVVVIF